MTLTTNSSFADGKASSGEGAAASEISPPVPTGAAATISDAPTVDPGPCIGFEFEAELAILEAQWVRDGIIMNATPFLIAMFNSSDSPTEASA